MSEISRKKLIKEFLDKIELELPFWLKNDEEELKDVLKELEEHIEDKAEAIEESGKTRFEATQIAIAQMGSPSQIVREYKRRGTPKFYITEELFPMFMSTLKVIGLIIAVVAAVLITVVTLVTGLLGGDWLGTFFSGLSTVFLWSVIIAAGITVLFAWLSYEGYFPEDIKKLFKSKHIPTKHKPIIPKQMVQPVEEEPKKEYPKKLDKTHNLVVSGIISIVFGIIAVVQPFTEINALIDPEFLDVLIGIGVFWIIIGSFAAIHGIFVSWSFEANKGLYPARAIISLCSISMIIILLMNPQIFPIPVWTSETGFQILSLAEEFYWLYYLVLSLIMLGIIVGAIYSIYKGATLEESYFFDA